MQDSVHTLIQGSEQYVGLPQGQMGNSEVGHLNLGAGRVVHQDFTRISQDVETGKLGEVPAIANLMRQVSGKDTALHLIGLLSDGGVHSHQQHIFAALNAAAKTGVKKVYIHAFLDGRDTPPKSAQKYLRSLQTFCDQMGVGQIASICGRYYAMDRDQRWTRIEPVYKMLTEGSAPFQAIDAFEALLAAYERGESDEFVQPTVIMSAHKGAEFVHDGDSVFFLNFRADRARQLTRAFVQQNFDGFARNKQPRLTDFVCMTQYQEGLNVKVAYPPVALKNVLGQVLADANLTQLRIAETEKYAHVTFFFNGGKERPFKGEHRELIPSPRVATYDLQPEMCAPTVTKKLVEAVKAQQFDVIICNFANPDMVGHTGNFDAAVQAVQTIDQCLGDILAAVQTVGAEVIITADHGNVEQMLDMNSGQPHTAHTTRPVPFVYVGRAAEVVAQGALQDVAPTLLYLMDLPIPEEMTGHPLIKLRTDAKNPTANTH
jgi:2,3-bisphosphoglycerate-independent phosphoglycerate mutase